MPKVGAPVQKIVLANSYGTQPVCVVTTMHRGAPQHHPVPPPAVPCSDPYAHVPVVCVKHERW